MPLFSKYSLSASSAICDFVTRKLIANSVSASLTARSKYKSFLTFLSSAGLGFLPLGILAYNRISDMHFKNSFLSCKRYFLPFQPLYHA
uniref:Uncharacterized protein n=1 Tax=Los Azufres archaeal virus 2 TaxID=1425359 RepID=A0A0A0P745_9VIRU|nr:hypothetical protein [Los Azufres archaeal virus 2]